MHATDELPRPILNPGPGDLGGRPGVGGGLGRLRSTRQPDPVPPTRHVVNDGPVIAYQVFGEGGQTWC